MTANIYYVSTKIEPLSRSFQETTVTIFKAMEDNARRNPKMIWQPSCSVLILPSFELEAAKVTTGIEQITTCNLVISALLYMYF